MLKLLWPLQKVKLRISGLIWRGTAQFVQNNSAITLPSDCRLTSNDLPCRTPATHFWRQIRSFQTIWYGFWICKSLFREKLMPFRVKNVAYLTLTWGQWSFPACWILIGQLKFPAPAICKEVFHNSYTNGWHSPCVPLKFWNPYLNIVVLISFLNQPRLGC